MLKQFVKAVFAAGFLAGMVSCSTPSSQSQSTGWGVNDPKWGGFQRTENYNQPVPLRFVFIQGGFFTMGRNQEDLKFQHHNNPHPATVSSFYMDEVETSNTDYNEYLYWLERVYGQDYPEVVERARPDALVWNSIGGYRDPMQDYFENPAYNNYPVVGVTWEQARDYCDWRTDRVNEYILVQAKILKLDLGQTADNNFNTDAYLAGQYNGIVNKGLQDMNPNASEKTRSAQIKDGILIEKLRLPTEVEWEYAALALMGNSNQERVAERRVYPWNGKPLQVRNPESPYRGTMMANFARGKGDYMGTAGALNDGADYTSPVYSYVPNDFGLYNMAGNVAEWCLDVYRPLTSEDADEINPFRGNIYTTKVRDEDGLIAEKDSLGRITYRQFSDEELASRENFQRSDNRNYLDGDYASAIVDDWLAKDDEGEDGENETGVSKSTTSLLYEYGVSSLISDKSRVIKGGSWKDRAYYLSPATRRYMDQDKSASWVGFRCAMSRVGAANGGSINAKR
ncbi:MAG: SUMF1/EgtB/PvdO family nonheme iron enzyme [Bacteroidales bacterium]|nr:SUMF1/EgtB/PvdO family nonheme iron enzyme [Bacteroidales bacterium]